MHLEDKNSHLPAPYQTSCARLHLVHSRLTCSRLQSNHQGLWTVCCVCRGLCYVRGFARLCRGWKDRPKTKSWVSQLFSISPPLMWAMQDQTVLHFHFRWSNLIFLFKVIKCSKTMQIQAGFQAIIGQTEKLCSLSLSHPAYEDFPLWCRFFSVSAWTPGLEETLKYFIRPCEAAAKETSSFLISLFWN